MRANKMASINKSRILIMTISGFEQSELVKPLEQLKSKGARVEIAASEAVATTTPSFCPAA
jgi:protease I